MGSYGLTRFIVFLGEGFWCFFFVLGVLGSLFSRVACFFSSDLKGIVALSSVFHMSLVFSSIILFSESRILRVLMVSCAHGFISAFLFYLVGVFYDSSSSRSLFIIRGVCLTFFGLLMLMGGFFINSSLPLTIQFFSELVMTITLVSEHFLGLVLIFLSLFVGGVFCSTVVFCLGTTTTKSLFSSRYRFYDLSFFFILLF